MKSVKPKISVIVPVYKVEKYIHECVDSILGQTYHNLEIILVDDGSPDNCGQICDEYAKKDPRIKVIHQQNQGLSMARNNGIEIASGDYIGFVDSDDHILPKMYQAMLSAMLENGAQMAECGQQKGDRTFFEQDDSKVYVETFDKAVERVIHPGFYNVMNKLYSRELIGKIRYKKDVLYEDVLFNSQIWKKVKKIVFLPMAHYIYSQEGESIIRSSYNKRKMDSFWVIKEGMDSFMERAESNTARDILRRNFLNNLKFHFHSLLENSDIDPENTNTLKIRKLILNHSRKPVHDYYLKLITVMPLSLYRIFYKLNTVRLRFRN